YERWDLRSTWKIFCYSGMCELEAAKLKETLDIIIKGLN
ncbi:hypothetical protein Q604_UNBc4C00235G0002, partial [human gut metagenome]